MAAMAAATETYSARGRSPPAYVRKRARQLAPAATSAMAPATWQRQQANGTAGRTVYPHSRAWHVGGLWRVAPRCAATGVPGGLAAATCVIGVVQYTASFYGSSCGAKNGKGAVNTLDETLVSGWYIGGDGRVHRLDWL
eukprot:157066-Pyramimonas_sp.AAC.1